MKQLTLATFLLLAILTLGAMSAVAAPGCGDAATPAVTFPGDHTPSTDLLAGILTLPADTAAAPAAEVPDAVELLGGTERAFCKQVCCFTDEDCMEDCPEPRKCRRFGPGCGNCVWR